MTRTPPQALWLLPLLALLTVTGACGASGPGIQAARSKGRVESVDLHLEVLSTEQRAVYDTLTQQAFCPCDGRYEETLATCVEAKDACGLAYVAADTMAFHLSKGRPLGFAADAMIKDLRASQRPHQFDTEARPSLGAEDAAVEVVVFEDFECPACKRTAAWMHDAIDDYDGRVRLVFKQFPLERHENARPAALASVAALRQGKFWELHDAFFAHEEPLDTKAILTIARGLGLDVDRLQRDMADASVEALVDADTQEGKEVDLPGTPTIYVNGVDLGDDLSEDRFRRRVDLELALAGVSTPKDSERVIDLSHARLVAQDGGAPAADSQYPMLTDLLALLDAKEQKRFERIVGAEICPCDGAFDSLDACLKKADGGCLLATRLAKLVMRGIKEGDPDATLVDMMTREVQSAKKVNTFTLDKTPHKGADPASAKLVIVEFADFHCHYCSEASLEMKKVLEDHPEVVLYYKHFPLNPNSDSPGAARGTLAAQQQGKFWEMHDMLFANQAAIGRDDVLLYAQQLGMNMEKFEAALDSSEVKKQVELDRSEGEAAGLQGTPAFFIDGVRFLGNVDELDQALNDRAK